MWVRPDNDLCDDKNHITSDFVFLFNVHSKLNVVLH